MIRLPRGRRRQRLLREHDVRTIRGGPPDTADFAGAFRRLLELPQPAAISARALFNEFDVMAQLLADEPTKLEPDRS